VKVQLFDLKLAAFMVGFMLGRGDQGPDALRRMGLDVDACRRAVLVER
jgi:hypothetical protein